MPIQPSLKPETVKKGQFEFNIFFSMFIQMEDLEIYQVLKRFTYSFRFLVRISNPHATFDVRKCIFYQTSRD